MAGMGGIRDQYRRAANPSGVEKDKLSDAEKRSYKNYESKGEKFDEVYIKLEKEWIRYYELKRDKEGIDKGFTRAKLGEPGKEQVVLELAMKQFQRAVKIVDQPLTEQGTLQFHLNPKARQHVIAMIYRLGVAGYRYDEKTRNYVYRADISDEYKSMLTQLYLSKHFNNQLKQNFALGDASKDFLALARYSNLMNIRIPGQQVEVLGLQKTAEAR